MRIAGILALTLLLPLTTFAALININTADAALLDTLPGIGPTKAQAIVDYRTQHGAFARIEDIQNVSGIGPSTYADIQTLITVGDAVAVEAAATSSVATASVSTSGASVYVPPPSSLTLQLRGNGTASLHVPLHLTARATQKSGAVDSTASITWSFGDGSMQTGTDIEKVYSYPGTYLVTAIARDGTAEARDELTVIVRADTHVGIAVSLEGISIHNTSSERLDVSQWQLRSDTGLFRIPEGTVILPQSSVLFPATVTNLPTADEATILYPDGIVAASSRTLVASEQPVTTALQPETVVVSSHSVQEVDTPLTKQNIHSYDQAVVAPTASSELAAVGAPFVSAGTTSTANAAPAAGAAHPLRSPWLLGLLGVIVAAGGAFIFI